MNTPSLFSEPNKKRLYLVKYATSSVHVALVLSPKEAKFSEETSIQFHVVNRLEETTMPDGTTGHAMVWKYDERKASAQSAKAAVRIQLGKIEKRKEAVLKRIAMETPVHQDDPRFTCLTWALCCIRRLESAGVIPLATDVENQAQAFFRKKAAFGFPHFRLVADAKAAAASAAASAAAGAAAGAAAADIDICCPTLDLASGVELIQ